MSTILAYFFDQDEVLTQKFKLKNTVNLYAIRPKLFKNGELQSGYLTFRLYDGSSLLASEVKTFSELNSVMGVTYTNGYLTWEVSSIRLAGKRSGESAHEYTLSLEWSGDPLKIAWCMEYENRITELYGDGIGNDAYGSRDMELWTWA